MTQCCHLLHEAATELVASHSFVVGFLVLLFVLFFVLFLVFVCLLLFVLVVDDDGLLDYVQVLHQFSFAALNSRRPRVLIWNCCFCNAIKRVKRPGESHEGVGRKKKLRRHARCFDFHVSLNVVVDNSFWHVFERDAVVRPLCPLANPLCGCFCLGSCPFCVSGLLFFFDETQIWLGDLRVVWLVCVVFGLLWFACISGPFGSLYKWRFYCLCSCKDRATVTSAILEEKTVSECQTMQPFCRLWNTSLSHIVR